MNTALHTHTINKGETMNTESTKAFFIEEGDTLVNGAYRSVVVGVRYNWLDRETDERKVRIEVIADRADYACRCDSCLQAADTLFLYFDQWQLVQKEVN